MSSECDNCRNMEAKITEAVAGVEAAWDNTMEWRDKCNRLEAQLQEAQAERDQQREFKHQANARADAAEQAATRYRELLQSFLDDEDEGSSLTPLMPQQVCRNVGYCPELGYPIEDWCLPCGTRALLGSKTSG